MPVPRVAIVGRPNVGKSSLLNMIAHQQVSIVDPTPGVTRDRVSILADLVGSDPSHRTRTIEVTDTGGFGVYTAQGRRYNDVGADLATLTKDIEHQIAVAVEHADIVLFVIDAQAGVTPHDTDIARMLRQRALGGKERAHLPIVIVANKVDGPRWEAHAVEAAALGFGDPIPVSAKNNYFRREFLDRLYELVCALPGADEPATIDTPEMKIAIIGKRNAGKSTLVNTLAGEQRVIVSEIAGTTRDAIDVRFQIDGRTFLAIDTAGLRKKKSFADRIEWWAFDRAQKSIERADAVLLLIDATLPVSQVDDQLGMLVAKAYKPVVIVVNKWDLAQATGGRDGRRVTTGTYETYLRKALKGLDFAPVSFISAETGLNVRPTIDLAFQLVQQARQRTTTGVLNRLLRGILETQGPSSKLGTFAKVYFVAQVAVSPPTIVCVVNHPELFAPNYQRFLLNRFREALPFPEVPIKLIIKSRKRADLDELLTGEYARRKSAAGAGGAPDTGPALDAAELEAALRDLPDDAAEYFDTQEPS